MLASTRMGLTICSMVAVPAALLRGPGPSGLVACRARGQIVWSAAVVPQAAADHGAPPGLRTRRAHWHVVQWTLLVWCRCWWVAHCCWGWCRCGCMAVVAHRAALLVRAVVLNTRCTCRKLVLVAEVVAALTATASASVHRRTHCTSGVTVALAVLERRALPGAWWALGWRCADCWWPGPTCWGRVRCTNVVSCEGSCCASFGWLLPTGLAVDCGVNDRCGCCWWGYRGRWCRVCRLL